MAKEMTAAQEPGHCGHECVCCNYPDDIVAYQRCPRQECPHDTRAKPAKDALDVFSNIIVKRYCHPQDPEKAIIPALDLSEIVEIVKEAREEIRSGNGGAQR